MLCAKERPGASLLHLYKCVKYVCVPAGNLCFGVYIKKL